MQIYHKDLINIAAVSLLRERLSGKTILLSGATGMIGKCIIDILMQYNNECPEDQQIHITALSRNAESAKQRMKEHWTKDTLRYISCDINAEVPECGRADYIIHAASNTHPQQYAQDAVGTIASNVIGTKNLLDYAVSHQAERFVSSHRLRFMVRIAVIQKDLRKTIWDISIVIHCAQDIRKVSVPANRCATLMPGHSRWTLLFRV